MGDKTAGGGGDSSSSSSLLLELLDLIVSLVGVLLPFSALLLLEVELELGAFSFSPLEFPDADEEPLEEEDLPPSFGNAIRAVAPAGLAGGALPVGPPRASDEAVAEANDPRALRWERRVDIAAVEEEEGLGATDVVADVERPPMLGVPPPPPLPELVPPRLDDRCMVYFRW